jgi:hypothetical protein
LNSPSFYIHLKALQVLPSIPKFEYDVFTMKLFTQNQAHYFDFSPPSPTKIEMQILYEYLDIVSLNGAAFCNFLCTVKSILSFLIGWSELFECSSNGVF